MLKLTPTVLCKTLIITLLFTALPMAAQYDAHLTGHVLDERTGEHLPYVNIQIKGTNIGTVTDESGHYLLQDLPIGQQTVIFSFVGYETLELPVTLEQDRTVELKAAIREVSKQLDGVVVTANRYATKRQEAATIVNVLSPKLFETTAVACMAEAMSFRISLTASVKCSPPAEYHADVIPKLVGGKRTHECAHICQLLTEIPVKCGFGIFIKCGEVA